MNAHRFKLLVFVVVAGLAACANTADTPKTSKVPYTVVAKGQHSGVTLPKHVVVKDPGRWQTLWQAHSGGTGLSPPAVDFSKSMIIAVFMGKKNTGGYSVDIRGIGQADEQMGVEVALHAPAKDEMVTMALTQPFIMVRVPRFEGEVMFRFESSPP